MGAITTGVLLAGALGLGAATFNQSRVAQRKAQKQAERDKKPQLTQQQIEDAQAERRAKARASISGGFGSSDTALGGGAVQPLVGKGVKSLIGG